LYTNILNKTVGKVHLNPRLKLNFSFQPNQTWTVQYLVFTFVTMALWQIAFGLDKDTI